MGGNGDVGNRRSSTNAKDVERVIAALHPEVDWPNAWEGGRLHGRDAVRGYWTRQFAAIDPHVEPAEIRPLPDGRIAVDVDQVVRGHDGAVLSEGRVVHTYELRDGMVVRMEIDTR